MKKREQHAAAAKLRLATQKAGEVDPWSQDATKEREKAERRMREERIAARTEHIKLHEVSILVPRSMLVRICQATQLTLESPMRSICSTQGPGWHFFFGKALFQGLYEGEVELSMVKCCKYCASLFLQVAL